MKKYVLTLVLIFLALMANTPVFCLDGNPDEKIKKGIKSVCIKGNPVFEVKPGPQKDDGGIWPFFQSCCFGPRVGLEANEGDPVRPVEIVDFVLFRHWGLLFGVEVGVKILFDINFPFWGVIVPVMAAQDNGVDGFVASMFLGPRVGMEIKERHIRLREWLNLVPVLNIFTRFSIAMEAYHGYTMTDIEKEEDLKRN